MMDMIVMTAILLLAGGGGLWLYIASRAVRPSRQDVRDIQMLERLQRIEEGMKQHATCCLSRDVPASSAACTLASHHREILENSRICGCCNCLQVFVPELIKRWAESGQTACCPFCGAPRVVSEPDGVSLNVRALLQMHHERRWADPAGDGGPSPEKEGP